MDDWPRPALDSRLSTSVRIAHVITRLILGGAQENTLLTCEDLQRDYGDQVLLVTGPALGPEGSLLERARANGVPLAVLPGLRRNIHPWRDLVAYRQIKRALQGFEPEVVHTHSGKAGLFGRAAAHALGVPAIVHGVHGAPFHPYQNPLSRAFFRICERWAARRCHAYISVADAMTDLMVAAGVAPPERFTTIYSGMEVEPLLTAESRRAPVRAELGYGPGDIVVGKVARLFHLKGHEFLLAAAPQIAQSDPRVRFLLVGDGILRKQLQSQVAALGLADRFRFLGLVPPQRIPDLLAATDIVVHTSLREGLARVLPQALIVGRPVISYDIDGAREVVLPGETGFLLEPRAIGPLAEAVLVLAADAALRDRMAATGRARCAVEFRHERMTARTREVYQRLLAGRTVSRAAAGDGKSAVPQPT
jgi:glycosyltransferase involved in cell wall biosynthesis